jgi:hypothetical protein
VSRRRARVALSGGWYEEIRIGARAEAWHRWRVSCPDRVKTGKARLEHLLSALPR